MVKLFYSYSHKDEAFREDMERSLALLRDNEGLDEWHDRKLVPGQHVKNNIEREIERVDIAVFLITPHFLASSACKDEWRLCRDLMSRKNLQLVSIILRPCPWPDFEDMHEYLAIPSDGQPVSKWDDTDDAWKDIYTGLKSVINHVKKDFNVTDTFRAEISQLEFCSQRQDNLSLYDLFVFPSVHEYTEDLSSDRAITDEDSLLSKDFLLIHGDEQCGKTTLARHLFLTEIARGHAALLLNTSEIASKKPKLALYENAFAEQIYGDFAIWIELQGKTAIFDDLTHSAKSIEHITFAKNYFSRIIIIAESDEYLSYFKDDSRLAEFEIARISPFTHHKQELLIKKWLSLRAENDEQQLYSEIDRIERNINAVIIDNKVLPRFPFFILSILQTYEAFMPQNVRITAYGHCYYVLIIAHFMKAGIDSRDDEIGSCLNFCSALAHKIFDTNPEHQNLSANEFEEFLNDYKSNYIIKDSVVNKLKSQEGIVKRGAAGQHSFSLAYSYYFFLGRYLASNYKTNQSTVSEMVSRSYVRSNSLTIIFAIHHAQDIEIIDDVVLQTMCALDYISPAKLDENETKVFSDLLQSIPKRILSNEPIEEQRRRERVSRDESELAREEDEGFGDSKVDTINDVYKTHKNIEILSQILRNKYGDIRKEKVSEIVETICDSGLRLVRLFLSEDEQVDGLVNYLEQRFLLSQDADDDANDKEKVRAIKRMAAYIIFLWTMTNIEKVVGCLAKPELRETLEKIRDTKGTPAYDIIYYFQNLDIAPEFGETQLDLLKSVYKKNRGNQMSFVKKVISIRTQHYMNTHSLKGPHEQATKSLLGLDRESHDKYR